MTPTGRSYLGIYDHEAPSDTSIQSRQLDPDAFPVPLSGVEMRLIFRAGEWVTEAKDRFEEALGF